MKDQKNTTLSVKFHNNMSVKFHNNREHHKRSKIDTTNTQIYDVPLTLHAYQ
jgi:hypothetical protein